LDSTFAAASRNRDSLFHWRIDIPAAIVVLILALWKIDTPSLWRDEAVTGSAAASGWSQILHSSRDDDAVHAPYYIFEWVWTTVFGMSETSLRVPSALAITVAAVCLMALGRLYTSELNAVLCTVIFVLLPATMRYAQEAREGAFQIMLAVVATFVLHVALRRSATGTWVTYAVLAAMIPLFNLVAAYILLPHFLLALQSKQVRRWCISAIPALLAAGLMAGPASSQRSTMLDVYLEPPRVGGLVAYADSLFGGRVIAVLFVLTAAAFVVMAVYQRRLITDLWLVVIAILPLPLWVVSHVQNIFLFRYGLYALPFFSLIAVLVYRVWYLIAAFIAILAVLSLPTQNDIRAESGHGENFRLLYAEIDHSALPGDAIVAGNWLVRAAQGFYLKRPLADPLDPHGTTNASIRSQGGLTCQPSALEPFQRVWFVWYERTASKLQESRPDRCDPRFMFETTRRVGGLSADLYTRKQPSR
jgi:mannosyltransferase